MSSGKNWRKPEKEEETNENLYTMYFSVIHHGLISRKVVCGNYVRGVLHYLLLMTHLRSFCVVSNYVYLSDMRNSLFQWRN